MDITLKIIGKQNAVDIIYWKTSQKPCDLTHSRGQA